MQFLADSDAALICRRDTLPWEDTLNLASFLGEKLHNLHIVPCPSSNASLLRVGEQIELPHDNRFSEIAADKIHMAAEWNLFISTLNRKRKDLSDRLTKWYEKFATINLLTSSAALSCLFKLTSDSPLTRG